MLCCACWQHTCCQIDGVSSICGCSALSSLGYRNLGILWSTWNKKRKPCSLELLFCKYLSCAWLNLSMPQSASEGPLRKCLPEVKRASSVSKGKGVERNLIQQRGCVGTVCEESLVAGPLSLLSAHIPDMLKRFSELTYTSWYPTLLDCLKHDRY